VIEVRENRIIKMNNDTYSVVKKCRPYLPGHSFKIKVDHQRLKFFRNKRLNQER
jgi:hypothetical protein